MEDPLGADDFLPVLIYILVNGDPVSVQLDVEYMMELMDPSQLQGEGNGISRLTFKSISAVVYLETSWVLKHLQAVTGWVF